MLKPTKACQKCGKSFIPYDLTSDKLCKHCRYLKKLKQDFIKKERKKV